MCLTRFICRVLRSGRLRLFHHGIRQFRSRACGGAGQWFTVEAAYASRSVHLHDDQCRSVPHCQHRGAAQRVIPAHRCTQALAIGTDRPVRKLVAPTVENLDAISDPDREGRRLALTWDRKLEGVDARLDPRIYRQVAGIYTIIDNYEFIEHCVKEFGKEQSIGSTEINRPFFLAEHLLLVNKVLKFIRKLDGNRDRDSVDERIRNRRRIHDNMGRAAAKRGQKNRDQNRFERT